MQAQSSSHATDTAALAACVNAASCYGISYEPSLAANVRWSARLGGEGVARDDPNNLAYDAFLKYATLKFACVDVLDPAKTSAEPLPAASAETRSGAAMQK